MTIRISAGLRGPAIGALIGWLLLTFCFAALGATASASAASFYAQLQRPDWAPPAWLFGPVWSALYLLMAIAAWRVSLASAGPWNWPLSLYVVQLAVNALWSWLFFKWHQGLLAFACILALWLLILATCVVFARRDRIAALLLGPYLAWVSFAGFLCYRVWQINTVMLG